MLIPYSTDAPLYHYPRMTLGLIAVNALTFILTDMGYRSDGWLLTYGNGLHPLEWVAYNFLHFGFMHLIGNMFFLWAFGIVVEGKLGWWRFLVLYLGIGITGGVVIQTAMLRYVPPDPVVLQDPPPARGWFWGENAVFAQDFNGQNGGQGDAEFPDPKKAEELLEKLKELNKDVRERDRVKGDEDGDATFKFRAGAGGASLVIYALMAIVLIWAPRNEVHCLWCFGFRVGTIELEYLYFCGFYIVTELLSAIFSARGFEVTGEIGHMVGVMIGFGYGILMVNRGWVDCENWDVFSIMNGKHDAAASVGDWHNSYSIPRIRTREFEQTLVERPGDSFDPVVSPPTKKKKSKPKPKLVEIDSFDESFDAIDASALDKYSLDRPTTPLPGMDANGVFDLPSPEPFRSPSQERIHKLTIAGKFKTAAQEYLKVRTAEADAELPQLELRQLADAVFKAKAVNEAAALLEEYIRRFPKDCLRQCVKLAVLYIDAMRRPNAGLKILSRISPGLLSDEYRALYDKAVSKAQEMISSGVKDVVGSKSI